MQDLCDLCLGNGNLELWDFSQVGFHCEYLTVCWEVRYYFSDVDEEFSMLWIMVTLTKCERKILSTEDLVE